jgi:membrane-bound metal-dependent hydrolase YbcI (DUF457 family)
VKAKAHATLGAMAGVAGLMVLENPTSPAGAMIMAGALVGSLAPDLDHHGAWLSRRVPVYRWILGWIGSNPVTWVMLGRDHGGWRKGRVRARRFLGHRQITHSLFGALAGSVALPLVTALLVAAGVWGLMVSDDIARWGSGILTSAAWAQSWGAPVGDSLWTVGHAAGALGDRLYLQLGTFMGGTALLGWIPLWWGVWLGWLSHLLGDAMTITGVPLFLPWSEDRVWVLPKALRLRTT